MAGFFYAFFIRISALIYEAIGLMVGSSTAYPALILGDGSTMGQHCRRGDGLLSPVTVAWPVSKKGFSVKNKTGQAMVMGLQGFGDG